MEQDPQVRVRRTTGPARSPIGLPPIIAVPVIAVVLLIGILTAGSLGANLSVVDDSACTAAGDSLGEARRAYANTCSAPRVDCDPMDGGWVCSSGVIGDRAPGGRTADPVVSVPASTTSTIPPTTTSSSPPTTLPTSPEPTEPDPTTTTATATTPTTAAAPTPSTTAPNVPSDDFTELDSIDELREAMAGNNGRYRMAPGTYVFDDLLTDRVTVLRTSGDNNIFDLTGVTLDVPTSLLRSMSGPTHSHASWKIEGNGNTFIGGTLINSYPNGETTITDFVAYNEDRDNQPASGTAAIRVHGDDTELLNNTVIVRGSFPYGYGEIFGKGRDNTFGLRKHSGIQVHGDDTLIDGLDLSVQAFGHGIFMQGADDTVIQNSTLEGQVRLGADMYEDGPNSLPARVGFEQQLPSWFNGDDIERDRMYPLTEDGIRAYASGPKLNGETASTGSITVLNTSVTNMRSCIALVAAKEQALVDNVHLRGCEAGFTLPSSGGTVTNSSADAAYGEVIWTPYSTTRNGDYDVTVVEAPFTTGDHNLVSVAGSGHDITLRSEGPSPATDQRPFVIGYSWVRWDVPGQDLNQHNARDLEINNLTESPVILTDRASGTTGSSNGPVTDNGSDNNVD